MNSWGDPTHHSKRQHDCCMHFHTTMQQNSRLGTPSVASECHLHRTRQVATQQPRLKPGGLCHLGALQECLCHGRKFENVEQFKQGIVLEWHTLSQRFIDGSINQWRRHLHSVVQEYGGHIEHKFN